MGFGLSDEEVWEVARGVADQLPSEMPAADCMPALTEATARRIEGST